MSEQPDRNHENPEERPSYTPASPVKRTLAWVGLAYMLALVGLNLYPFFHGGNYLRGVYPLLVCPAAAGLAVLALLGLRRKDALPSQKAVLGLMAAGCAATFVLGLVQGLPPLLAGLGV